MRCSWIKQPHYGVHTRCNYIHQESGGMLSSKHRNTGREWLAMEVWASWIKCPCFLQTGVLHLPFIPSSPETVKWCICNIDYMGHRGSFVMPESSRNPSLLIIMCFSTTPTPLHGPFLIPPFAVALVTFPAVADPGYIHLLMLLPKAASQLWLFLGREKLNTSQKYSCCQQAAVVMNENLTFPVCFPILSSFPVSCPLHSSSLSSCCCV